MIKIILITPILQHYRITFYEKLSNSIENVQLQVLYGIKKKEDGRPGYWGQVNFLNRGFPEIRFRLAFEIVYNLGMYSYLKKINPDIIVIQGITGNISYRRIVKWARQNNKKIIVWTCGWEPGRVRGLLLNLKIRFVTSFFKKADYFLTYSEYGSRYVSSMGIDGSVIETCFNGIETDVLEKKYNETLKKSQEIRYRLNLTGSTTFLFVGGLIAEKKPLLLIDAFIELQKKYKDTKLIIIGDGPLRSRIEERIRSEDVLNIIYLGRIIDDVDSYFAASDCFVLPGVGGLALNQAMFWGKTCIVSKADGTEDDLVIDDVTGYRFMENDIVSLVSAMERRTIERKDKIEIMAEKSQNLIRQKSNVNNMVRIFSSAITKFIPATIEK